MAKKNDYWEERTRKRRAALDRDVEKANKELIDNFETALKDVQARINDFWIRYAKNNEVTLSQAQQLLALKEWKAFKGTLEEFQQLAKDSIGTFNLELENLSMRARISRYQELELNVKSVLDQLYQKQNEVIGRTASDAYMDQYFHSLFNIEQYKGVHTDFMIPNARAIEELVKYPFNGADYSERLWRHQEDLTFKLKEALTNMFVEGKNPYDYKDQFASLFQVKRNEAYRLLDTEHAYIAEAASQAAYEAEGIEEYKINATLDTKTSKICREMDGKVFKVSDRKEGKNCPPFHPYCRTTTEPYIPELDDIQTTRVAKDADGKNFYVPADMTYDEWYERYGYGSKDDMLSAPKQNDKTMDKEFDVQNVVNELTTRISVSDGLENQKQLISYYAQTTSYIEDKTLNNAFSYSFKNEEIRYNPDFEDFGSYNFAYSLTHELSHKSDGILYFSWVNQDFIQAIDNTSKLVMKNIDEYSKYFEKGGKYENETAIADIFSALTHNVMELPAGHSNEYWDKEGNKAREIFANISSIDIMGLDSKAEFDKVLKEIYNSYRKMVE